MTLPARRSTSRQTALRYRRHRQPPLLGGRAFLGGKSLADNFRDLLGALVAKILGWKPEESLEHAKCSHTWHAPCEQPKQAIQVSGGVVAASLVVVAWLPLHRRRRLA